MELEPLLLELQKKSRLLESRRRRFETFVESWEGAVGHFSASPFGSLYKWHPKERVIEVLGHNIKLKMLADLHNSARFRVALCDRVEANDGTESWRTAEVINIDDSGLLNPEAQGRNSGAIGDPGSVAIVIWSGVLKIATAE